MKITKYKVILDGNEIGISNKFFIFLTRSGLLISIDKNEYLQLTVAPYESSFNKYKEIGLLVESHDKELKETLEENELHHEKIGMFYLPVMPTKSCQLNCGYCGQEHKNRSATDYAIERIKLKILKEINSREIKTIELGFFGGEPFLGFNWIVRLSDCLKELMSGYPYIKLISKIVTNGISIDEKKLDFLANNLNLEKIEITIDGPKEIHDLQRSSINGKSYFDRIIRSIHLIKKYENIKCVIRCNIGISNYKHIESFIDFLTDQGFNSFCYLYFAPIHSWGNSANTQSLETELFSFKSIYWKVYLRSRGWNNVGFLPRRKFGACIATKTNSVIIDPDGAEFDCTEMPLVKRYESRAIQSYMNTNLLVREKSRSFESFNLSVRSLDMPCSTCFAFPVCGGACPKEWNEGRVPCPSFKYTAKEALKSAIVTKEQHGNY